MPRTTPVMMDRALGAIATGTVAATSDAEAVKRFGMHYQWGRKDPFTPATNTGYVSEHNAKEVQIYNANGTAITKGTNGIATTDKQSVFKYEARTTTNQTTINHLIQNPSTHYNLGNGTNGVPIASTEYYNTTEEGDWWNPTIKTIYDPCPNGYRIPKSGTYGNASNWILTTWDLGTLTAGNSFNKAKPSLFPVSGYRNSVNGTFGRVGSFGYSWMSTPNNFIRGHFIDIKSNIIHYNASDARSASLPTRCIKEQ